MKSFFAFVFLASVLPLNFSSPSQDLYSADAGGRPVYPQPGNYGGPGSNNPPLRRPEYPIDIPGSKRPDGPSEGEDYNGPNRPYPKGGKNDGDYDGPKDNYKPGGGGSDYEGKPIPSPDKYRSCPDPFPSNGKYKLEHVDNRKLFSFCTGGCIKKDNKVYRPALKSVVSKDSRDSREWYDLWDVHKSAGNKIKLSVGDVGCLKAEKGKYGEDVAVYVDTKGEQLWTVTVHPNKNCAITIHNDQGQYVKRGINGRFTVLRSEYFSPEIAGLLPKDDTCYFNVIPDKSY